MEVPPPEDRSSGPERFKDSFCLWKTVLGEAPGRAELGQSRVASGMTLLWEAQCCHADEALAQITRPACALAHTQIVRLAQQAAKGAQHFPTAS